MILAASIAGSAALAQNATGTVTVGSMSSAIAVNTATNKIYVANQSSNSVTVIDGATNTTTTVPVAPYPTAIAVNTVTNLVYVAGGGTYSTADTPASNSVTVIDGLTNATTAVPVGPGSTAIAVNEVTNKVYVNDDPESGDTVKVIDGPTQATTTVPAGPSVGKFGFGGAIAVNPVTNKIYATDKIPSVANIVTVIDGTTNATTTVPTGVYSGFVAVNATTNRIYVSNVASSTVTVIDGATNATATVATGTNPNGIAVNPVTNRIYTANNGSNDVTVIDGATNATTTVPAGPGPIALAVNPVTNMVYVADNGGGLTVIDGATNEAIFLTPAAASPVAVNPVTDMVYFSAGANTVAAIAGSTPALASGGPPARLINISTRAQVGTGGNILIPGFVIGGSGTETLLIRADGPALTAFAVPGALASPSLVLTAQSDGHTITSNTGWGTNPDPAQIASVAAQVGAFALTSGSADCAVIVTLGQGAYTVQVSGVGGTTGVALAEVYEVSHTGTARLVNIATRAQVGTGGNIIIPGFVIAGSGADELLVRADGPGLSQFGVTGVLAQPSLSLIDNSGNAVASNTGWTSAGPDLIAAFENAVGAFSIKLGSADSAQVVLLPPGAYTLPISGVSNTTGVALAEVYEVP